MRGKTRPTKTNTKSRLYYQFSSLRFLELPIHERKVPPTILSSTSTYTPQAFSASTRRPPSQHKTRPNSFHPSSRQSEIFSNTSTVPSGSNQSGTVTLRSNYRIFIWRPTQPTPPCRSRDLIRQTLEIEPASLPPTKSFCLLPIRMTARLVLRRRLSHWQMAPNMSLW